MAATTSKLSDLHTGMVAIACDTGLVLACEGLAPLPVTRYEGRDWRDVLGVPAEGAAVIAQAVEAGVAALLPPFIIASGSPQECVMGGMLVPQPFAGQPAAVLFLRQLDFDRGLLQPGTVAEGDVIAVFGIDQLEFSPGWGAVATERLMLELRVGLQQVRRDQDWLGMPVGATLALVLRAVAPQAALDISRALLSHLHQRLQQRGFSVSKGRASIGLAQQLQDQGPLDVLVAANGALLQAQAGSVERIRFASPWDQQGLAARAINSRGAFVDHHRQRGADAFPGRVLGDSRGTPPEPAPTRKMETGIEGYVLDNMEGALDQAVFLAGVDMPIAVIGPRGTGKMYIAQVINTEAGGAPEDVVRLDCRVFGSRAEAQRVLERALRQGEGRTIVFKSPQLLHGQTQARLARILATRTISSDSGSHYLPRSRYVALFPDSLERLVARGELDERLAGVFAGYPIQVPPLRDRGRAVLRWAHKILEQEATQLDRSMAGFTADAEQAMQQYHWPGNISEMRGMIRAALGRTEKEWVTPVDLGIFAGIRADGSGATSARKPFLTVSQVQPATPASAYTPSPLEQLRAALAQALATTLAQACIRPLGHWLDDDVVLAAMARFGDDTRAAAQFLQTRPRNIGRWMPKIQARARDRHSSLIWREVSPAVRQWVLNAPPQQVPPQPFVEAMLLELVQQQCEAISAADRARIMGLSTPTYQKRLKQTTQEPQ